ncbi:SMI1/KNR4 family protein [Paenibacillus lutimineralis]|uniref:SMI1/KNR4 family protein n=1 Tax=Paenibacillus lutimineralis TaxID=2707005 RepID=A0A3Q9II42_9BACL|nr:SMI1/KNR4 family protein [Paenibacillus lutimineralis]AZS18500.1 SMI1/KNR4 family protein [Paenibacillus lutimineralis]
MRDDLIAKLDELHEADEFEEIVNTIMEIPTKDRDYELTSHLGRAMNNLERYEEAVEQFLTIAEEGQDDPLWHYRIGLAYYYLEQYENARREFEMADRLEPGDQDTLEFLEWIANKTAGGSVPESREELEAESESHTEASLDKSSSSSQNTNMNDFWEDSEQAKEYISKPVTDEQISSVEEQLVFKLPASYINMMKIHNGGIPHATRYPVGQPTSHGKDYIVISGIFGIGRDKPKSLCGKRGSRYMIENYNYPEIGVVICDCSSAGDAVMLDYRPSGNDGEPEVIYVDRESNNKTIKLADNFEAFIQGLMKAEG